MSSGGQGWPRFSRPPEGLVLDGREHDGTLAVSERKTTMRGSGARLVTTAIVAASRFPFPQSLQKSGNSNREVHRLSRFRDHQTACSCLPVGNGGGQCNIVLRPPKADAKDDTANAQQAVREANDRRRDTRRDR